MTSINAINNIMAERLDWVRLLSQKADETLDVYLDLKSPHAYLAVRPSLEVARDFRVAINFLPYTLSYETLGVSKTVGAEMKREPASPAADRKARMYYAAAREYAALQSLPFKSPYRLLDSSLAHKAFLFAKQQTLEVPFAMWVYLQGWASGWQEFELESAEQLRTACENVGADTNGFDAFVQPGGEGEDALAQIKVRAEASGISGAPHYVYTDHSKARRVGLFGREHLALIRGKYAAAGLARRIDVVPEFSHAWPGND
jgi:2-hydroxychromene-2-carboxylate isomerase